MTLICISRLRERKKIIRIIRTIILRIFFKATCITAVLYIQLRSPHIAVIIIPSVSSFTIYKSKISTPSHSILVLCIWNP